MSIDQLTIWNADVVGRIFGQPKRISLVGNGTVEADSTAIIQSSDVVIRFNNWATRPECVEKTLPSGTLRCDMLVTHLDLHSANMGKGEVAAPRLVVLGIPAPFQIDNIPKKLDRWHPNTPVAMVNPYWNRQLCQALSLNSEGFKHPLPTLGMTAIYHLARMNLSAEFYVCGFDWHFDPATDRIQGHAIDAPRLPGNFNHWYVREAVWITRSLYRHERWKFSARAARTLARLDEKQFTWEQNGPVTPLAGGEP
jgi:hypothetical protein